MFLQQALHALGYTSEKQQSALLMLYHLSGALTEGIPPETVWDETEAQQWLHQNTQRINQNSHAIPKHSFLNPKQSSENNPNDTFSSASAALDWLNEIGQKQRDHLRPAHTERQQMRTTRQLEEKRHFILEKIQALGFIDEVLPENRNADAILILGASQNNVSKRLHTCATMLKESKLSTKKIILISGARDLWPSSSHSETQGETLTLPLVVERIQNAGTYKNQEAPLETVLQETWNQLLADTEGNASAINKAREKIIETTCATYQIKWPTETDMMRALANELLSGYTIEIVDAPKIKITKDGQTFYSRPTTKSTLESFKEQYRTTLTHKNLVVFSSQPYCKYQQGIVNDLIGHEYTVDMVASEVNISELSPASAMETLFASVYANLPSAKAQLEASQHSTLQLDRP
jgi:hypothetical protein